MTYTHDGIEYESRYDFTSRYKFTCPSINKKTSISKCVMHPSDCRHACDAYRKAKDVLNGAELQCWNDVEWNEEYH